MSFTHIMPFLTQLEEEVTETLQHSAGNSQTISHSLWVQWLHCYVQSQAWSAHIVTTAQCHTIMVRLKVYTNHNKKETPSNYITDQTHSFVVWNIWYTVWPYCLIVDNWL